MNAKDVEYWGKENADKLQQLSVIGYTFGVIDCQGGVVGFVRKDGKQTTGKKVFKDSRECIINLIKIYWK